MTPRPRQPDPADRCPTCGEWFPTIWTDAGAKCIHCDEVELFGEHQPHDQQQQADADRARQLVDHANH